MIIPELSTWPFQTTPLGMKKNLQYKQPKVNKTQKKITTQHCYTWVHTAYCFKTNHCNRADHSTPAHIKEHLQPSFEMPLTNYKAFCCVDLIEGAKIGVRNYEEPPTIRCNFNLGCYDVIIYTSKFFCYYVTTV